MRVDRLEHKLGIRASDTATIIFENCRVPAENLLGSPEVDTKQGFAGAMATFDNTRPLVASMAVGCATAALDLTRELLEQAGVEVDYDRPAIAQSAAAAKFLQMESDREGAQLLMLQAAWMADNREPNSLEASMAKAKAGRVGSDVTLSCVELAGSVGYSESELLEKWARDSKILDIFEGTQQIQQLIVARRVLGLSQRRAEVGTRPADSLGRRQAFVRGGSFGARRGGRLLGGRLLAGSWRRLADGCLLGRALLLDDAGHVGRGDRLLDERAQQRSVRRRAAARGRTTPPCRSSARPGSSPNG